MILKQSLEQDLRQRGGLSECLQMLESLSEERCLLTSEEKRRLLGANLGWISDQSRGCQRFSPA